MLTGGSHTDRAEDDIEKMEAEDDIEKMEALCNSSAIETGTEMDKCPLDK